MDTAHESYYATTDTVDNDRNTADTSDPTSDLPAETTKDGNNTSVPNRDANGAGAQPGRLVWLILTAGVALVSLLLGILNVARVYPTTQSLDFDGKLVLKPDQGSLSCNATTFTQSIGNSATYQLQRWDNKRLLTIGNGSITAHHHDGATEKSMRMFHDGTNGLVVSPEGDLYLGVYGKTDVRIGPNGNRASMTDQRRVHYSADTHQFYTYDTTIPSPAPPPAPVVRAHRLSMALTSTGKLFLSPRGEDGIFMAEETYTGDAGRGLAIHMQSDNALIDCYHADNHQSGWVRKFLVTSHGDVHTLTGNLYVGGGTINVAPTLTTMTSTTVGSVGNIRVDGTYIYVCTAANRWKRVLLSDF